VIKAAGLMSGREFGSAVTTLKSLDTKPLLRDNANLLTSLAEAQFYNGELTSARDTLHRVCQSVSYDSLLAKWTVVSQSVSYDSLLAKWTVVSQSVSYDS